VKGCVGSGGYICLTEAPLIGERGQAEAVTLKVTFVPAGTVRLSGCVVITGKPSGVKVAMTLVMAPDALLTITL